MNSKLRIGLIIVAAVFLFSSGYVAGQNKFGQPKTVIHVVTIKWKSGTTEAEQQKALEGVKEMASQIPGIKNVWLRADRVQPRDYNTAFAIEFADRAAADHYSEDPVHAAWAKSYLAIRQASISVQVTN